MKTTVETAQTQIRASGKGSPTGSDWLLLCSVSFEFGSATSAKLPQPDVWSNTDPSGFVGVKLRATVNISLVTRQAFRWSLMSYRHLSRGENFSWAPHIVQ